MRWETLALLALLVVGACWAVFVLNDPSADIEPPEGAQHTISVRLGTVSKGSLSSVVREDESVEYWLQFPDAQPRVLTATEVEDLFGPEPVAQLATGDVNQLYRVLNITNSVSLVWVLVGLLGQIAFFLRMTIQWVVSEKRRESVVPEVFWWLSFIGGVMLFSYFIWRKDIIGVLGQSTGVVIYARNIRLIHKAKLRAAAAAPATA